MKYLTFIFMMLLFIKIASPEQIVQRHTVKKGETLTSLASKYKTSVDQLKKWNNISTNKIYPGQTIIVSKYQEKQKADNIYIVKKGDTLSTISEKTGVSIEKLKIYNNLESTRLYPGQKIALSGSETKPSKKKEIVQTIGDGQSYFVKNGDTLSSISRKTGVPIDEIKRLNNLKNNRIHIGQKLVLNVKEEKIVDTETQSIALISDKKQEIKENEETSIDVAAESSKIVINKYHKIKKGETLSSIAKKYGTTVASIKKLNNLKSNAINTGRTIIVARIVKEVPPAIINPTPIVTVSPKIYYNVKIGDTLESIASKFGISVTALKETNLLSDGRIKVGQTLVIPQVANITDTANTDTSVSEKEDTNSKLLASKIIENALNFINTPYRLGGLSENGIDCSGLVKKSYEAAGIVLPRTSREQAKKGEIVPISAIKPGDLLFFGHKGRINHVGIYIGDNKFIHASRESGKVVIANLEESYYQKHLVCARTFVNGEQCYWIEQE